MADGKTYNGFANYETWAVSLWMSNDYASYVRFRELARSVHLGDTANSEVHPNRKEAETIVLAQELRDEFCDSSPIRNESSVYADLMHAALAEVNWYELAEELLSSVHTA